jgi:hypothetical protein
MDQSSIESWYTFLFRISMKNNRTVRFVIYIIFLLSITGCTQTNRIVIDGPESMRILNNVVLSAIDPEAALRGNTAGNIRNGGYVVHYGQDVLFLNQMEFEDGTTESYLQTLGPSQIGSDYAENAVLAPLDGILAGIVGDNLYYIDTADASRVAVMDLRTSETEALDTVSADSLHLLDGVLYYSDSATGDIWLLPIDGAGYKDLVAQNVGRLIGVSEGWIYAYDRNMGHDAIVRISLQQRDLSLKLSDGPYENAEVSGSWLFFTKEGFVWRQAVDQGEPILACILPLSEYVISGDLMAGASPDGGIFVSRSDGTGITQMALDKAWGISIVDNRVYYKNYNDDNAVYYIELEDGKRTRLQGDTLTDGGIWFTPITGAAYDDFAARFAGIVEQNRQVYTHNEMYSGNLSGNILFAVLPEDGSAVEFYRMVNGGGFSSDSVGALVVIIYRTKLLGYYTDGGAANRIDTILTLFAPYHPVPHISLMVEGKPPTLIKHGAGDRTGLPRSWHQKALEIISMIKKNGS